MPEAADKIQEFREAIEAGNTEAAERLAVDIFSGDSQNSRRLYIMGQMILSGAAGSFIGIGGVENITETREEKERKKSIDSLWDSFILSEQIRALEARIADLNRRIADLTFKIDAKEREIAGWETEKSKLEAQKAHTAEELENTKKRIQEIEDTYIPDLERAILERDARMASLIEDSGLSEKGQEGYHTIRETAKDIVTIGIKLPGDPDLDPPPKHVVHKDEQGRLYVEDKNGNKRILPEDSEEYKSAMRQIAKGEKLGNQLDPEELRKIEEAHRIYYSEVENNPDIRAALRPESNENFRENSEYRKSIKELQEEKTQLEDKVKALDSEISDYDAKIAELDEKIRLGKIDLETMTAEREKLALQRDELQNQLEEAKIKQQENIAEIKDQTAEAQRETARLTSISTLTRLEAFTENIDRFAKGEIGLDKLFENASADIKARIQDPALRLQLENIALHESLSPTAKATSIIYFTTAAPIRPPEPASIPVKQFSTMPSVRADNARQLIPVFETAAAGTTLMSPASPNMSPAKPENAPLVIGAAP